MALVLANQGQHEEALKIYKDVLEKKKRYFGVHHPDTLRTLNNIAAVLANQKKYRDALKTFEEAFEIQKKTLQKNHPETLNTQLNMGNVLFAQSKWISALKVYRQSLDQRKAVFGPYHPTVLDTEKKINFINEKFVVESGVVQNLQKDIYTAARDGDTQTVHCLLHDGAGANDKDKDGRTPLHYAVDSGQIEVVKMLLSNGADVTQVTNKGNTPLHTGTSKGCNEIIEILLKHSNREDFLNAKTTGTTSLHVAAKNGSLKNVKLLLRYGAIYNIKNREGKTPLELTKGHKTTMFLKLIEDLFRDTEVGNDEFFKKLKSVETDEFMAITNARNIQGKSLLKAATSTFKHSNDVKKLFKRQGQTDL